MEQESILQRLTIVEQEVKSARCQIDEMKNVINSIYELTSEVKHMRTDLNKIQTDLDTVKDRPAKRYELVITTLITAFVSGIMGFVLSIII